MIYEVCCWTFQPDSGGWTGILINYLRELQNIKGFAYETEGERYEQFFADLWT